jgi:hypothetical protein
MNAQSNRGYLSDITPTRLSKKDRNHRWVFAVYYEFSSDRSDGRDYRAFLFRDDKRTVFGLKEFWDSETVDFRKLATRIIQDEEFRKSFVSADPDLPKVWKRH